MVVPVQDPNAPMFMFSNDPLQEDLDLVRARHIQELRDAANDLGRQLKEFETNVDYLLADGDVDKVDGHHADNTAGNIPLLNDNGRLDKDTEGTAWNIPTSDVGGNIWVDAALATNPYPEADVPAYHLLPRVIDTEVMNINVPIYSGIPHPSYTLSWNTTGLFNTGSVQVWGDSGTLVANYGLPTFNLNAYADIDLHKCVIQVIKLEAKSGGAVTESIVAPCGLFQQMEGDSGGVYWIPCLYELVLDYATKSVKFNPVNNFSGFYKLRIMY